MKEANDGNGWDAAVVGIPWIVRLKKALHASHDATP